jgi:hypothetical protein
VVETDTTTSGAGARIAAAILALFVLLLLFMGFTQWHWFGTTGTAPSNSITVTTPAPPGNGGVVRRRHQALRHQLPDLPQASWGPGLRQRPSHAADSTSGGLAMATLGTRRQNRMPAERFAFPKQRKEPISDAAHVRNALARFDQVEGVSDADRDAAWRRIRAAARKYGVEVHARGWRQLMNRKRG